jgi:hypothetical protein
MLTALLDANVLHPMSLCDLLIRLALSDLYRPLWSRPILEETARSILRRRKDIDPERMKRRIQAMEAALPGALVDGHERHLGRAKAFGDDAHVVAAAIVGDADVIVTSNLKDFPAAALRPLKLTAISPDELLVRLWREAAGGVAEALRDQAAATRRPPLSVSDILAALEPAAPRFVAVVRKELPVYAVAGTDATATPERALGDRAADQRERLRDLFKGPAKPKDRDRGRGGGHER